MEKSIALERSSQCGWESRKVRLLLVDDEVEDLLYYSAILDQLGYEVRAFTSYGEATACLGQEAFDLVVVSQGTSNFEGRSVLARAVEKDRRIPVLILTRAVEIPCYLEAIQLGARDYIEKPLLNWEIAKLVAKYLPTRPGSA